MRSGAFFVFKIKKLKIQISEKMKHMNKNLDKLIELLVGNVSKRTLQHPDVTFSMTALYISVMIGQ